MKNWYLLFLILFFMTSSALAMPDNLYDKDNQTPLIYDDSANLALLKKLKEDFHKKYPATLSYDRYGNPIYSHNYPLNAYRDEVVTPYDLQKDNEYHYIKKNYHYTKK